MAEIVRKQFISSQQSLGERMLQFIISTAAKDRDNDTINPEGWIFDNYLKNPVVLFAHDYESPAVAKTRDIKVENGQVVAVAEFPTPEIYQFGYTLYLLYREGFMNAVSVGFVPLEYKEREDGYDFIKQELLEYSLVPVPSNPEALIAAKRKGINIVPLYEWASKILEKGEKYLRKEEYEQIEMAMKDKNSKTFSIEEKGVIPYKRTPLADPDTPWDAGEEVKKADVEDLKIMCTWYDKRNPDVKASYKLPHHKAEGEHACVWRGVVAAMAALFGARGGVDIPDSDRKGVYEHLAKHYEDFGKEPPEFKEYTEEELEIIFNEDTIAEDIEDIEIQDITEEVQNEITQEEMQKEEIQSFKAELDTEEVTEEIKEKTIEKVGRTLSKENEERIRKAISLLQEVLSQIEGQEEEQKEKEELTEEEIRELIRESIEKQIKKILGKLE